MQHVVVNHAYTYRMRKHTTIDLDMRLVREAGEALGTQRVNETVHRALSEVVARRRRSWLAQHDFAGLTPETLAEMRSPRTFAERSKPASPRGR